MKKVDYKITVAGKTFESSKMQHLLELELCSSLDVPVNGAKVVLSPDADISDLKPEDTVKVEIGYDGTLSPVFTGVLSGIKQGIRSNSFFAVSSFASIAKARLNLLYEKQDAGKIAEDIIGRFKITKGDIQAGEKFPVYMLSDTKTVWQHLYNLSVYCGFDFYADWDDKFVFKPYKPEKTHIFEYGQDIADLNQTIKNKGFEGAEVYGESPAGQGQGEDAVSWLTKKDVKGAEGKTSGVLPDKVLRDIEPLARNQDLAKNLAKNIISSYLAESKGRLKVLGSGKVKLGDKVKIEKMPAEILNKEFKILGVTHILKRKTGFITQIDLQGL